MHWLDLAIIWKLEYFAFSHDKFTKVVIILDLENLDTGVKRRFKPILMR